jgi:hypothetical protein
LKGSVSFLYELDDHGNKHCIGVFNGTRKPIQLNKKCTLCGLRKLTLAEFKPDSSRQIFVKPPPAEYFGQTGIKPRSSSVKPAEISCQVGLGDYFQQVVTLLHHEASSSRTTFTSNSSITLQNREEINKFWPISKFVEKKELNIV